MHRVVIRRTGEERTLRFSDELSAEMRAVYEDRCGHLRAEPRRFIVRNGAEHIYNQCLDCGTKIGGARPASEFSGALVLASSNIEFRYKENIERKIENIKQKYLELQDVGQAKRAKEYAKYLKSPEWAAKRAKVLRRAAGVCEGCAERSAAEVHHLTYNHIFQEFLFELVALCIPCHERIHSGSDSDPHPDDCRPCNGCRMWGGDSSCARYSVDCDYALSVDGPCGAERRGFEPLR